MTAGFAAGSVSPATRAAVGKRGQAIGAREAAKRKLTPDQARMVANQLQGGGGGSPMQNLVPAPFPIQQPQTLPLFRSQNNIPVEELLRILQRTQ